MDFQFFWVWVILPILIFVSQVLILSLSTLRIIYLSRYMRFTVAAIGFVEVLLWLFAVSAIVQNLTNPLYYIAYASGFAVGNYAGVVLEGKVASGIRLVRVITKRRATKMIKELRKERCRLTNVLAMGEGFKQVNVLYIIVKRKNLNKIAGIIRKHHPKSFFSVEDIDYLDEGAFPVINRDDNPNPFKRILSRKMH